MACISVYALDPPYEYDWTIINATSQDIVVWINVDDISVVDGTKFTADRYYEIASGDFYSIYGAGGYEQDENFYTFINNLHFLNVTTSDQKCILIEFNRENDDSMRNLFDENEWKYSQSIEYITSKHFVTNHEWTFTITDADLVGVEE